MAEVTFSPFDQLFDANLTAVLLNIFERIGPGDYDSCANVCTQWKSFIVRHFITHSRRREILLNRKLPYEWLHGKPRVAQIAIANTLAPPLKIYADSNSIVMTTIDSMLIWNRKGPEKTFRGEVGPELSGASHVMISRLCLNSDIFLTAHKHTTILLVWSRKSFCIIQQVPCIGIEGEEATPFWIRLYDLMALVWLEDGSIIVFNILKDGTLKQRHVLNGHIAGNHEAAVCGNDLLSASGDSKVNLWDLSKGRLKWSNHRTEARYKRARLTTNKAVVAGSYDHEGYLQIYDRRSGDVLHEMLTLEGTGIQNVAVSETKIVAQLAIKHKLLTAKLLVLDISNGDVITEQTFVDVLDMNIVKDSVLVLAHNQIGDFRTRISAFDLGQAGSNGMFQDEKIIYQYMHNYWKLPILLDDTSVIHTSEEKADLFVRDFDSFFSQYERRELSPYQRRAISGSTLCYRLRQILFKKMCSKCCIM